jgi:hypothetical protein
MAETAQFSMAIILHETLGLGTVASVHAYIYSNANMQDLGAFGPNSAIYATFAYGINDHGQVVGCNYL